MHSDGVSIKRCVVMVRFCVLILCFFCFLVASSVQGTTSAEPGQSPHLSAAACAANLHGKIAIRDIGIMQFGLRKRPALTGVNKPVIITKFPDGRLFLRDGYHRLKHFVAQGKTELEPGIDFLLEESTYEKFNSVIFYNSPERNDWTTPFNPNVHCRLAFFLGYKRLIDYFLSHGISQQEVEAFIRKHPEAYSISKEEIEFKEYAPLEFSNLPVWDENIDGRLVPGGQRKGGVALYLNSKEDLDGKLSAFSDGLVVFAFYDLKKVREVQLKYPVNYLTVLYVPPQDEGQLMTLFTRAALHVK